MAIAARSQPQGLARINRSNPLARGLRAAMLPQYALTYDAASGGKWSVAEGAFSSAAGPKGIALHGTMRLSGPTVNASNPFTLLQVCKYGPNTSDFIISASASNLWTGNHSGPNLVMSNSGGDTNFGPLANNEEYVFAIRRTASAMDGFKNGVFGATTGNTPSGAGPLIVMGYSGGGYNWSGNVYLTLWWDRPLTDAEVAQISANPWQVFESPSQTQFPQAAAATITAAALSGTASAVASATGSLTTSIPLAASAAVVASASASLSTQIALTASAAAQAAASASLSTQIALSGTASGAASASAALSTQIPLSGSAAAQASASATLTTSSTLSGTAAGSASASATLTTSIALSGAAVGAASASATLTTGGGMAASASAQASASATLTTHIALAGAAIAQAQASAALAGQAAALSGSTQCGASASATLTTGISLAAAAQAQASGQAALSTQIALVAIAQAQASASAQFAPTHPPTERVYMVNAESRLQSINPQSRAYVVDAQLRTNTT